MAFTIEGDFRRDGVVVVRRALSPEHVELARAAIDANLEALSPLAKPLRCRRRRVRRRFASRPVVHAALVPRRAGEVVPRWRVLSVRFLGDDMVHAPREWVTSPPLSGLADELPAGAPMDHPLFPVLFPLAFHR